MKRVCPGVPGQRCGLLIPANRRRCQAHAQLFERQRVARRRVPYDAKHQRRAREAIEAEPWCHWPDCWRTEDLTADHSDPTDPDSELVPLCRSHNTAARHARDRAARGA